jgi:uncharacterized protein (TIGR03083 family)
VKISEHVEALTREGERLRDAAAGSDLDAPVPSCPGWTVRDAVQHTGEVHRWAAAIVREARTSAEADPVAFPPDEELLPWFEAGHAALVSTLAAAPPELECFTFLPAPSPLAFWARRQAHETAIHRADVESASGAVTPTSPDFATDGVDELLMGFASRKRRDKLQIDAPRSLHVRATDTARDWCVSLAASGITVTDGASPADCGVSSPASDLYLLLWNRRGLDGLEVTGDGTVVDLWRRTQRVRWS